MTGKIVATALALTFTSHLHADVIKSHQCERYGIQRTVELITADGASVPCKVVYSRPMEDQSSTSLWNARHDASFCQQKYDSFIVKLETKLNWSCTAMVEDSTLVEPEPMPGDAKQVEARPEIAIPAVPAEQVSSVTTELTDSAPENAEITEKTDIDATLTTEQADAAGENLEQEDLMLEEVQNAVSLEQADRESATANQTPDGLTSSSSTAALENNDQAEPIEQIPAIRAPDTQPPTAADSDSVDSRLLAALTTRPLSETEQREISLELIREYFPTGHYTASTQTPHSGDTSLCPSDGFFIWNTQRPDKPTFEVGGEAVFIFNLGQFSSPAGVTVGGGQRAAHCDYDIQSNYCGDNTLQAQASVTNKLAATLRCSSQSVSNTADRPLTLLSELSGPVTQACQSGAPAPTISLSNLTPDPNGAGDATGLEIVVASDDNSKAQCRYVSGR